MWVIISRTSVVFLGNYVIAVKVIVSRQGCSIVILLPFIMGTSTRVTNQRMGNVHTAVEYAGQLAPA